MNSVMDLLQDDNQGVDTAGLFNMINRGKANLQESLHSALQGTQRAELQSRQQNVPGSTEQGSESIVSNTDGNKLQNYIDENKDLKYSQKKRDQQGYGDCSTYACKLQSKVYGKKVPTTTLGMMRDGTKVSKPQAGDIAIYDTGNGNRHALTWLPNGNQIGLGNSGVSEYQNYDYPLIGNFRF